MNRQLLVWSRNRTLDLGRILMTQTFKSKLKKVRSRVENKGLEIRENDVHFFFYSYSIHKSDLSRQKLSEMEH